MCGIGLLSTCIYAKYVFCRDRIQKSIRVDEHHTRATLDELFQELVTLHKR